MAKEVFERTKPHVNMQRMRKLQEYGVTAVGAQQLLNEQAISNASDRRLIYRLVTATIDRSISGGYTTDFLFVSNTYPT